MGAPHQHRVHASGSMFGGPEGMDDGMQMPPVGTMHPDMMADQIAGMPPGMNDPSQMLKHAVCNLINYQVLLICTYLGYGPLGTKIDFYHFEFFLYICCTPVRVSEVITLYTLMLSAGCQCCKAAMVHLLEYRVISC